jgi:hypothetical protein
MNKKGQAAMEFLTTYGWAFLVILVVIAGLYYMDVFSFDKALTTSCTSNTMDISCGNAFRLSSTAGASSFLRGGLKVELKNNLDLPIHFIRAGSYIVEKSLVDSVDVIPGCQIEPYIGVASCPPDGNVVLPGNSKGELTLIGKYYQTSTIGGLCPSGYSCATGTTGYLINQTVAERCGISNNEGKQKTYVVNLAYKIQGSNIIKNTRLEITTTTINEVISVMSSCTI